MTKLFIDFDETIFNHYAMLDWLDKVWQEHYGAEPGVFRKTIDDYHVHIDETHRLYKHREHYALSGKPWEEVSAQIRQLVSEQNKDFCYPEAHDVLRKLVADGWNPGILTFGDAEYQLYKINHCKVLTELKLQVIVVDEPKKQYLAREYPAEKGILVDDKYPLNLPANWRHIWVNRGSKNTPASDVITINSLTKLPVTLE